MYPWKTCNHKVNHFRDSPYSEGPPGLSSRSIPFDFNFKLWKVLAILSFEHNLIQSPANAGSGLGTKNALYYCAQSANSIS